MEVSFRIPSVTKRESPAGQHRRQQQPYPPPGRRTAQQHRCRAEQQQTQTGPVTVEVASLVPQDSLTIPVTIDERDIHSLALGQTVQVRVEALSGREFTGTVTEIGRIGASSGGSSKYTVTVELRREEDMLPGMSASVTAALGTHTGIAIPVAALIQTGSRSYVYTALDEKTGEPASPVEVTPGFSDGEYVLILSGLSEGDTVYYPYYEALES